VTRENKTLNLQSKQNLFLNDVITTDANSSVLIETNEGDLFTVFESSNFEILSKDRQTIRTSVLNMTRGSLRFLVKKVTGRSQKEEKYEVITPAAVMGIRGTQGIIEIKNKSETKLFVLSGLVRFAPKLTSGDIKEFFVSQRQRMSFSQIQQQVSSPQRYTKSDIENYLKKDQLSSQEFEKDAPWLENENILSSTEESHIQSGFIPVDTSIDEESHLNLPQDDMASVHTSISSISQEIERTQDPLPKAKSLEPHEIELEIEIEFPKLP
jgi:hypothetical protein